MILKTPIERGSKPGTKPINWAMVKQAFKLSRLPLAGKVHPWARPDVNSMRYLPVNEAITGDGSAPMPLELLYRLIDEASHRMIVDYCVCRKSNDCESYPVDIGCLVLGDSGLEIPPSVRREVDAPEAREFTDKAVAAGLVPFVGKIRVDNLLYGVRDRHRLLTVCFCCECCCFTRYTREMPVELLDETYTRLPGVEIVVGEECTGCGKCADICFMEAVDVTSGRAVIGEYCRACGRCATSCPSGAIEVRLSDPEFLEKAYLQIRARVTHT
jgi:ferredoxin